MLRDGGEAYAIKLDQAGVTVTSLRYNGMIYDFGLLNPLSTVPTEQAQLNHAAVALQQHLK